MEHIRFNSVIFDLDGTLIDSFSGIEASLRHAIEAVDPDLDTGDLRPKVGPPLPSMLAAIWPEMRDEKRNRILALFRHHYNNQGCLLSESFPGIPELLFSLHASGRRLFVLTNKPEAPTLSILGHLGLKSFFQDIVTPDATNPHLPDKTSGALLLIRRHALDPGTTLMVGDSKDDLMAAEAAGFQFAEAAYGYGFLDRNVTQGERLRLKSPADLSRLIQ